MPAKKAAPLPNSSNQTNQQVEILLRQAKRLHRSAKTGSISHAMPVLRRIVAAGVCPNESLSSLFKQRETLQRKHLLRMLAVEAGYPSWEKYKPILLAMSEHEALPTPFNGDDITHLNLWFSNEQQAQAYANEHGGKVLKYGQQAVVIKDDPKSPSY